MDKGSEALEIVTTRVFDVSRERLFGMFTDAKRLAEWWGPKGFKNTFHQFELRSSGIWKYTMHGPNGHDYPNEVRFLEVVRPERIVFEHLVPWYHMTILLEDRGEKCGLTWRQQWKRSADDEKFKQFLTQANEENFDRLQDRLTKEPHE